VSSYYAIIGSSLVCPSISSDWNACIPASMKRRDPRIWHIAYAAAHKVITETNVNPVSIIAATALGALDETKNFLDTVFDTGFGNPRHFIASVHNSMAGKIALELKITGPNITVCEGQNSLASAISLLDSLDPSAFPALIVLIDEHIGLLDNLHPSFSPLCKDYLNTEWVDGAFAVIVDSKANSHVSHIRASAAVPRIGSITSAIDMIKNTLADNEDALPSVNLCKSSYLEPGIAAHSAINDLNVNRSLIGSYAPASDSVAIIDIIRRQ